MTVREPTKNKSEWDGLGLWEYERQLIENIKNKGEYFSILEDNYVNCCKPIAQQHSQVKELQQELILSITHNYLNSVPRKNRRNRVHLIH